MAINRDTRSFCDGIYLRVGFCRSKQKVKNAKSKGCGATFLKLSAFGGDYEEGVWGDLRIEVESFWS